MAEAGLPLRPEYVIETPEEKMAGRKAMARLMALSEPPAAVFVENSFISPELLYPAHIGETDSPCYGVEAIHFEAWDLTTMEQALAWTLGYPSRRCKLLRIDWEHMGRLAARRVLERISGEPRRGKIVRVAPVLYEVEGNEATACEE
jgi:hypothetical protein